MQADILRGIVFYCFLTTSEKKLIAGLEIIKKGIILLASENLKVVTYIIINKNFSSI